MDCIGHVDASHNPNLIDSTLKKKTLVIVMVMISVSTGLGIGSRVYTHFSQSDIKQRQR